MAVAHALSQCGGGKARRGGGEQSGRQRSVSGDVERKGEQERALPCGVQAAVAQWENGVRCGWCWAGFAGLGQRGRRGAVWAGGRGGVGLVQILASQRGRPKWPEAIGLGWTGLGWVWTWVRPDQVRLSGIGLKVWI